MMSVDALAYRKDADFYKVVMFVMFSRFRVSSFVSRPFVLEVVKL